MRWKKYGLCIPAEMARSPRHTSLTISHSRWFGCYRLTVILGVDIDWLLDSSWLSYGILSCRAGFNGHGWYFLGLVSQVGVCCNLVGRFMIFWIPGLSVCILFFITSRHAVCIYGGDAFAPQFPSLASGFFHGCRRWTMIFLKHLRREKRAANGNGPPICVTDQKKRRIFST